MMTDRKTVCILRLLEVEGVDLRSRNRQWRRVNHSCGPNYAWHIDGYDKLWSNLELQSVDLLMDLPEG